MAYVTRPAIAVPPYEITTAEIVQDIAASLQRKAEQGDKKATAWLSHLDGLAQSIHVERRRFVAPFSTTAQTGTAEKRNLIACEGMLKLAKEAADKALAAAGLTNSDIDVVITSHSTTRMTPGLDVHLVNYLDLRPDVMRMPATQLGCVGGAHTLSWAAQIADAFPGKRILVVVAEALSSVYQPDDDGRDAVIFRMLFGDGAGACIVSSDPLGPGLHVEGSWQYAVPGTMHYYALNIAADGEHFTSTRTAPSGVNHLIDPLWAWLRASDPHWTPEVVVAHPGGPKILDLTAKGLGCAPGLLSHSWDSLRDHGNMGGVAVLHILSQTHDDRPRHGSQTLMLSVGPGLSGAALAGRWHAPTSS